MHPVLLHRTQPTVPFPELGGRRSLPWRTRRSGRRGRGTRAACVVKSARNPPGIATRDGRVRLARRDLRRSRKMTEGELRRAFAPRRPTAAVPWHCEVTPGEAAAALYSRPLRSESLSTPALRSPDPPGQTRRRIPFGAPLEANGSIRVSQRYFGAFPVEARGKRCAFSTARWARSVRPPRRQRARPCGPRWLPGRGAMRHVELDRRVLGLQSTDE